MNETQLAIFKTRLCELRSDVERSDELGREGQRTVTLDQQSVGRLSRMDALQHQAMARATQTRRDNLVHRIALALGRIDEGEYGYCDQCGEEIPEKRLDLDPTLPTCVNCAQR